MNSSGNSINYGGLLTGAGGLLGGISQGGAVGDTRAALSAASLASRLGAFGQQTGNINSGLGAGGNLLGLYTGLMNGGVAGDTGAAVNAAQLATKLGYLGGASGALGQSLPYVGAAMSAYNLVNNWRPGATGADALNAASTGAGIGTLVMPGVGTAVGAALGGLIGAVGSTIGNTIDPETRGVQNLINATSGNGNTSQIAANVQNPYLQLAGLFDRQQSTLPIYSEYGRMGESKFSTGLINTIQTAYNNGQINKNSTPQYVYNNVVAPWVNNMGSGWSDVGQTYTATTQGLIQDMVAQYMNGSYKTAWQSRGGQQIAQNAPAYGSGQLASTDGTIISPQVQQIQTKSNKYGVTNGRYL